MYRKRNYMRTELKTWKLIICHGAFSSKRMSECSCLMLIAYRRQAANRKTKAHSYSTNNLNRNILAEPCLTWFWHTFTVQCTVYSVQFLSASEAFKPWDWDFEYKNYNTPECCICDEKNENNEKYSVQESVDDTTQADRNREWEKLEKKLYFIHWNATFPFTALNYCE